ncbi:MAG: CcdB family protein [Micropepsaceae bacterium]
MRQFDVLTPVARTSRHPFVVVLQHDQSAGGATIIVAPCIAADDGPRTQRLTPLVEIKGKPYRVIVPELAAIATKTVSSSPVANLALHRDAFTAAIDLLFTGI